MQKFEPDQLVLVKYAGNTIWRLRKGTVTTIFPAEEKK